MNMVKLPSNILVVDGVRCRIIGGKQLVTFADIAAYTGYSVGTISNKASNLGLTTYRLGRFAALEKVDADFLVLGGEK